VRTPNTQRMKKIVVLLTGAADVESTPLSLKQSSHTRKQEYINALNYYAQAYPDFQFVYSDSSGYDPRDDDYALIRHKNIIFHSSLCQNIVSKYGKGAGEQISIKTAFSELAVLREASLVLKINGRYKTTNLGLLHGDIINSFPTFSVFGSFRHNLKWFDSRCFAAPPQLYFDFCDHYINDFEQKYFEHALSLVILKYISQEDIFWKMFDKRPRFEGKSGNTGLKYNTTIYETLSKDILYVFKKRLIKL
jgi:hypothetical protein